MYGGGERLVDNPTPPNQVPPAALSWAIAKSRARARQALAAIFNKYFSRVLYSLYYFFELELELIQSHMTQESNMYLYRLSNLTDRFSNT